jgi:hypothetical protein
MLKTSVRAGGVLIKAEPSTPLNRNVERYNDSVMSDDGKSDE